METYFKHGERIAFQKDHGHRQQQKDVEMEDHWLNLAPQKHPDSFWVRPLILSQSHFDQRNL
mgnify:CR=1 FL=1